MRIWNVKKTMHVSSASSGAMPIPTWWDGSRFTNDHAKRMKYTSRKEAVIESKKHHRSYVEKDFVE